MELNDLISRKALLEAFSADTQHVRCWDVDLYDLMVAEIEDAPTVNAAPVRHGEWTVIDDDWNEETIYQCSVCKEEFVTIDETPAKNYWNYCPNCGAKMDLEVRQ